MDKTKQLSMTEGPILGRIIRYSLPLILTGILQLLYTSADQIVVGRFAGETALAAVGSTGALNNLIVNLFMGLSTGASVVVAQHLGAKDHAGVKRVVHTAVLTAFFGGFFVMVLGLVISEPVLMLMGTPEDTIDQSVLYMRIIFLGMPGNLVYNYCAGILRASGDTKHPLYFLSTAGIVNVVLNLVLVIVFGLDVDGVAIATIVSQYLSAVMILIFLAKRKDCLKLSLRELRIDKQKFVRMVVIGLPCGMQGSLFSISNVIIQSSVNSLGTSVMAGNTAGSSLDGFIYIAMNALHHACMNFTGQNVGARRYDRIPKLLGVCMAVVTGVGLTVGGIVYFFREPLLSLYIVDENAAEVIKWGSLRLLVMATTYFLCGLMETINGCLRGMGQSLVPAIITLLGVCGVRILWVFVIFPLNRTLSWLYVSFPVSWFLSAAVQLVLCIVVWKKFMRKQRREEQKETVSA